MLDGEHQPTARAYLRFGLGMLELHPSSDPNISGSSVQLRETHELIELASGAWESGVTSPVYGDIATAVEIWIAMLEDDFGMFPLEQLGAILTTAAKSLVDAPRWADLTARFDELTAAAEGRARAASNAYDRAVNLHDAGRIREAIAELHHARVDWYGGDNLPESVHASLALASCYAELGLHAASKQFALSAVFIARTHDRDDVRGVVPHALALAAQADFSSGRWLTALPMLQEAVVSAGDVLPSAYDPDVHAELRPPLMQFAAVVAAARDLGAGLDDAVRKLLSSELWAALRDQVLAKSKPQRSFWLETSREQLRGMSPFMDAGGSVRLMSSLLGLRWIIEADSADRHSVLAAYRLAALLEVVLVELAEEDLCLLRGTIRLKVIAGDEPPEPPEDALEGEAFEAYLMPCASLDSFNKAMSEALATILASLSMHSVLPMERVEGAVMRAMGERNLISRLFAGRFYDELALAVVPREGLTLANTAYIPAPCDPPSEHPALRWRDTVGPTYSPERAAELIRQRYETVPGLIAPTLIRLSGDADFATTCRQLRQLGWLDWHILQAVHSIVVTVRMNALGEVPAHEIDRHVWRAETEADPPVDPRTFTVEYMTRARQATLIPILESWGLELNNDTSDPAEVERFLAVRYRYWLDDVPHNDPFQVA